MTQLNKSKKEKKRSWCSRWAIASNPLLSLLALLSVCICLAMTVLKHGAHNCLLVRLSANWCILRFQSWHLLYMNIFCNCSLIGFILLDINNCVELNLISIKFLGCQLVMRTMRALVPKVNFTWDLQCTIS